MALFAGVQISLAQVILRKEEPVASVAWHALRFFTYTTIVVALGGTALSLSLVKLCTELPIRAKDLLVLEPNSVPAGLARGRLLPKSLLMDDNKLLEAFGMPRVYIWLDWVTAFLFMICLVLIFISIGLWVWLTEPWFVSLPLTFVLVPASATYLSFVVALQT